MKLNQELKRKIDAYFDGISAEKLFEVAVVKYGFTEITIDIENKKFNTSKTSFYRDKYYSTFNNNEDGPCNDLPFAA